MDNSHLSIPISYNLIQALEAIAESVKFTQPMHLLDQLQNTFINIKQILNSYESIVVRFTQKSNFMGQSEMMIAKIILKLHQILLDVRPEGSHLFSNNTHEAHGLFHILKHFPDKPAKHEEYEMEIRIDGNPTRVTDEGIYINFAQIILAVTARGQFNPYINAIVSNVLNEKQIATLPIREQSLLAETGIRLTEKVAIHVMDQTKYEKYLNCFVWGKSSEISDSLDELATVLWYSVLSDNKDSLAKIERLLVGLLGHRKLVVRDMAVQHLNSFYDDTDWQLHQPFKAKIRTVGQSFVITERVVVDQPEQVLVQVHAPGFHRQSQNYIVSYHKIEHEATVKGYLFTIDLGQFTRCGFYDWRFVQIKEGTIRQVVAEFSSNRGSYANLKSVLQTFPVQGRFIVHPSDTKNLQIHEVFIDYQDAIMDPSMTSITETGNFQTVTHSLEDKNHQGINCLYLLGAFERDWKGGPSPLSLTSRSQISTAFGGEEGFIGLMRESQRLGIHIILDCVSRISSRNFHRKYKDHQLYIRNEEGLPVLLYGTDGLAIRYYDSLMLNYRQSAVWDLLVSDVLEVIRKYKISGVHLDNAQAWPQLLELDKEEMYRKDPDGQQHYTAQEIFDGLVVKANESFGFWTSNHKDHYANPIFVKLCKELWREFPDFFIIADIWKGVSQEERDKVIVNSGPIPRLYDLPIKLAQLFGKQLKKDGTFTETEKSDASSIRAWYEQRKKSLPDGAIVVQSLTGHTLPYPALLYGRGAWAVVDLLFFMQDIPMTYIGEQNGRAYKPKILNLQNFKLKPIDAPEETEVSLKSRIPMVSSTTTLSMLTNTEELVERERKYAKDLGPEYGFDLEKIHIHYNHRRNLRHEKDVLRYGELIPLVVTHDHGWHKRVIAFARCIKNEICIIITNLNDNPISGYIDLSNLEYILDSEPAMIFSLGDWMDPMTDDYFFKHELLREKHPVSFLPYRSGIIGIYPSDVPTEVALQKSVERLRYHIEKNQPLDGCYGAIELLKFLQIEDPHDGIKPVANLMGLINKYFLEPYTVEAHRFIKGVTKLTEIEKARLLGYCDYLNEIQGNISPQRMAASLLQYNRLGPIVFTTPELGRWSTVGGLGVMVDELSIGLAALGEDVWVISPYYEVNKRGQSGYLQGDPANVQ